MKRFLVSVLVFVFITSSALVADAADNLPVTNIDRQYKRDYTSSTEVKDDDFTPGNFSIGLMLDKIGWLGITDKRTVSIHVMNGADPVSLAAKLPNLRKIVLAQVSTNLVGYTFSCSNSGSWDTNTGQWTTSRNDPVGRIRTALNDLKNNYIITQKFMNGDGFVNDYGKWPDGTPVGKRQDNKLLIKAGTRVQYGSEQLQFSSDCTIDDLYDAVKYTEEDGASSFAYCIYSLQKSLDPLSTVADKKITMHIPAGTVLHFCETKFTVEKDIDIEIDPVDEINSDPLTAVYEAIETAAEPEPGKYKYEIDEELIEPEKEKIKRRCGYTCDADAVFNSGFGLLNELIGVLAESGTTITIGKDGTSAADSTEETTSDVCAELVISSACQHKTTEFRDVEPTVIEVGYEGNVYCSLCGKLLKKGKVIAKLPSSINLSKTSVSMKTGGTDSTVKVGFVDGDYIKSIKSSDANLVKAVQSGTDGIKLTAFKKTGTASVTVTLAGGKSAILNVKVTSAPCTKLTVNKSKVSLKKGKSFQIKPKITPAACVQKVTYKSSNKKVATVTSAGKIKAKKKGTAKITVKCGTKSAVIKVTVK